MPMRIWKTDTPEALVIERRLHIHKHKIELDRKRCVACELCSLICPREAISLNVPEKESWPEEAGPRKASLDIDEEKCQFCGICNCICPFGAVRVSKDGEPVIPVAEAESFPRLLREVEVDTGKCKLRPGCVECEEACPLGLIRVRWLGPDGRELEPEEAKAYPRPEELKVEVSVDLDACPGCRLCELRCPEGAIRAVKVIHGSLRINTDLCPDGCRDCVDACPVPGTLEIGPDGKVRVNEMTCVYCGACRVICPVEGAIELVRTHIRHEPVKSGAWNKALEKLTSPVQLTRELAAKSLARGQEVIEKRLAWKLVVVARRS